MNARDQSHKTPLHRASFEWDTEIAQLLVEHGADVHAKDENRSTLLHLALSKGDGESAQLLIQQGANVNEQDGSSKTPLYLMLSRVSAETIHQSLADVVPRLQTPGTGLHIGG